MKILFLFFLYFFSLTSVAEEWKLQGDIFTFKAAPDGSLLPLCSRKKCAAEKVLTFVNEAMTKNITRNGNPAAFICEVLKGKVILGTDAKQNEESFCMFSDKSVVSNYSLALAAKRNSKRLKDNKK